MHKLATSENIDFNPISPEFYKDPHSILKKMRESCQAYLHDTGCISFFHYDDVKAISADHNTFSSVADPQNVGVASPENIPLVFEDPPQHDMHRAIVNKIFAPGVVRQQESVIQQYVDEVIDSVIDKQEFDVVEDFAGKITTRMIAQMLGIPNSGLETVRYWTKIYTLNDGYFLYLPPDHPKVIQTGKEFARMMKEMPRFFESVIDDHIANPDKYDDILTVLIDTGLSREILNGFCILILVAGNETTTNLINNALRLLIDYPEQQQMLRDDPGLMNKAIEEIVRYMPSLRYTSRRVTMDTVFNGVELHENQWVNIWWISANMDPRLCENPEVFDITRKPTRHLSFGHGLHSCLGNALARAEARVTLKRIIERTDSIERMSNDLPPLEASAYHGVGHHWIRFVK